MAAQMEADKKACLLFLLAVLLQVRTSESDCPVRLHDDLECLNDFNYSITCVWNSTSEHTGRVCTLNSDGFSCNLEPVDDSTQRKCSLMFYPDNYFLTFDTKTISISCESPRESLLTVEYEIACNIKPHPPGRPNVNFTTISWTPEEPRNNNFVDYGFELQWKRHTQSWTDAATRPVDGIKCVPSCKLELYPEDLEQGETYEARVRVQFRDDWAQALWSDWSPTASWKSPIGTTKPPPTPGPGVVLEWDSLVGTVVGAVLAISLAVILLRTNKNTWVYIVKKIKGPPLPNPAKSFLHDENFQVWLSSQYTSESVRSMLKPADIVPVEVITTLDAVMPWGPEAALLEKKRWDSICKSDSSSYSNPSYSKLCPPPLSSLTGGNLEACAPDSPYGPVGDKNKGAKEGTDTEEKQDKDREILQLLSKASESGGSMEVSSDYERVEKLQAERCRLQSPDSGMGSFEEEQVSQESMEEADDISMTGFHGLQRKEIEGGKGKEADFLKLFGDVGCGGVFSKGSIQVCSDYERVERPQAHRDAIPSPDSGMGSGGEEQVSQESLEDIDGPVTSKASLFPFPPSGAFRSFPLPFTSQALNFCRSEMSSASEPLSGHMVLQGFTLAPSTGPIEPSGGGYMPVNAK